MINKVTITGADNSVDMLALEEVSYRYPFVEWGILVSRNQVGNNRFPSINWIRNLYNVHEQFNLSCHLCGAYVREILMGNMGMILDDLKPYWRMFDRVQINTHGIKHNSSIKGIVEVLERYTEKEFIFQFDEANGDILDSIVQLGHKNISTLFDMSHGAGILPSAWPKPIPGVKCGYAGGIGPDNIKKQIELITEVSGDLETWIDMETHVRSDNDKSFDIVKVVRCLESSCESIPELLKPV